MVEIVQGYEAGSKCVWWRTLTWIYHLIHAKERRLLPHQALYYEGDLVRFSIWFKISTRWRLLRCKRTASETVAEELIPRSMKPRFPRTVCKGPIEHQASNQKEACWPLLTSTRQNSLACGRYLRSFLHIQEPIVAFSLIDQNEEFRKSSLLIQSTQRESAETRRQISLKQLTLLASTIDLSSRPPSCFGLHMSLHETFAFFEFNVGPDQRKAEQIFSISLIQALGSLKAVIQKLVKLEITKFRSCNLPA